MSKYSKSLRKLAWYAFDMGNSAHALLVSTIGYAIFFKEFLYESNELGNTVWGIVTALILLVSAVLSPLITSWAHAKGKRSLALVFLTILSVITTVLLATHFGREIVPSVLLYVISAISYYLALPVYNSYLLEIAPEDLQRTSARGWALGYIGGIMAVGICYVYGFVGANVMEQTALFQMMFFVAGAFNLVFSLPILVITFLRRKEFEARAEPNWNLNLIFQLFQKVRKTGIFRLFIVYWLIGEIAVVITYYFALFLKQYAHLETKEIMIYSVFGQIIAFASTWASPYLIKYVGGKRTLIIIILIWFIIPFVLFSMTLGVSFWFSIIIISLVIGVYHSVIRGRVAELSENMESDAAKGSLFGFLEVAGRISQFVGPLLIGLFGLSVSLKFAILIMAVFPALAFILIRSYKWN